MKVKDIILKEAIEERRETDKAEGAIDAFNRMEAKVDRDLDTAEAMTELNEQPVDEAEELERKYAGAASDSAVEDELSRLKSEMGL